MRGEVAEGEMQGRGEQSNDFQSVGKEERERERERKMDVEMKTREESRGECRKKKKVGIECMYV